MSEKNIVYFYVWCINNIDGFTIDDVPIKRRDAVQEQIDNEGVA